MILASILQSPCIALAYAPKVTGMAMELNVAHLDLTQDPKTLNLSSQAIANNAKVLSFRKLAILDIKKIAS